MAFGKSLEREAPRKYRLYTNGGSPIKRSVPKVKMSKKERRKARADAAMKRAELFKARESMVKQEASIKDAVVAEALGE